MIDYRVLLFPEERRYHPWLEKLAEAEVVAESVAYQLLKRDDDVANTVANGVIIFSRRTQWRDS